MHTPMTDAAAAALADDDLKARLARTAWETDPLYLPDEQVFRLFHQAQNAGDKARMNLFIGALCARILGRARAFAARSGIYPGLIGDLDDASLELAQFIWDRLQTSPTDSQHAERAFGQLFERRGFDFQRRLLAKKRKLQVSFDDPRQFPEDEDPEKTIREVSALRESTSPADAFEKKRRYREAVKRLQAVLTQNEYAVFVMLHEDEMMVKDIAKALGVSVRTINTYKNQAMAKIAKEFSDDIERS